jgi:hypothetical protein
MRNAELDTLIDERVAEALTAQNLQVIIDQRVAAALAPPPPKPAPLPQFFTGTISFSCFRVCLPQGDPRTLVDGSCSKCL